ncbi:hypothetical protein TNCV_251151 [Trichonephila clavipes]|nr:hypothetical protein TNCV_251151 [Trichonephila clavipes]
MEEIVEKVSAAPYVTVMDLSKGYFQIPLTPRAQRYAAFVTPFGTYIPKKMMFGLCCMKGNTRNRWRDGPVCPAVDKELWCLGPDSSGVFWRVMRQ